MSALHDVDVDVGSLLDLALGVASAVQRFDLLLDEYAPGNAPPGECPCEATLHVMLGLVSLRDRIKAALEVDPPYASQRQCATAIEGSWLR